jgi:hypothetical protein
MAAQQRLKTSNIYEDFEKDYEEWQRNRDKYKQIRPKPENCSWYYTVKDKHIGARKRLADIYQFKIECELGKEV